MVQYLRLTGFSLYFLFYVSLVGGAAFGHGGGLDSSGGHNCYVGSCAGTYHNHQSNSSNASSSESFLKEILIFIFVVFILGGIFWTRR